MIRPIGYNCPPVMVTAMPRVLSGVGRWLRVRAIREDRSEVKTSSVGHVRSVEDRWIEVLRCRFELLHESIRRLDALHIGIDLQRLHRQGEQIRHQISQIQDRTAVTNVLAQSTAAATIIQPATPEPPRFESQSYRVDSVL